MKDHSRSAPPPALVAACALSVPTRAPTLTLDGIRIVDVLKSAALLGTIPAVARNLQRAGHDLPDEVAHMLEGLSYINMIILETAGEALEALESAGCAPVPIKGLAVLNDHYSDDVSVRRMSDVDILIGPDAFDVAAETLARLGWRRDTTAGPILTTYNVETHFEIERPPVTPAIDLHRALAFPCRFTIDTDAMLGRATHTPAGRRLSVTDQLLYLAVHKAMHGHLNACHDLADAAVLIRDEAIDWPALVRRAGAWSCAAAAHVFLRRAREHFGALVPDHVMASLDGPRAALLNRVLPTPGQHPMLNGARPLLEKSTTSLLVTDAPHLELAALAAVTCRKIANRLALATPASTQDAIARRLDRFPIRILELSREAR